ncbi:MAG: FtsX-like permease family protein [Bacteroidota bacterium]
MIKNLLKIAFRNILKDKTYSLINVFGLTIGITCSLFILTYVLDELSYDRYHENADNIYRIVSDIKEPDNAFTWAVAQIPLAEELRDNYPDVVNAVRFFGMGRRLFENGEKQFYEEGFFMADSTVFDMFSYKFIAGDPETALDEPNTVVLTKSLAVKYFDDERPLGQLLTDQSGDELKVTGVIEDVPTNSHFTFDALISRSSVPQRQGSWGNFGVFTYIQLPEGYDPDNMQPHFDKILAEKVNPIFESIGIEIKYVMQNIPDIHLHSKIQDEAEEGGDISYVYIFSAIAIFMLIIASINYMNLATARSAKRAKEVGVRKAVGSSRKQIITQFITESVVVTLVALVLSIILIYAFLPSFNVLANKSIDFAYVLQPTVIFSLLGVVIFVGLVGGSYPAFYLSGFSPVNVLKGKLSEKGGNLLLRKILVVIQFGLSVFMLVCTLVVFDQLQFIRTKDLGFNIDQLVRVRLTSQELRTNYPALRNRLMSEPYVTNVATATTTPGSGIGKVIFNVEDNDGEMIERGVDFYAADFDYISTLEMDVVLGRDFSKDILSDTTAAALVNEAMVRRMNWDEPLGKKFRIPVSRDSFELKQVIGVIKDYHQNSLYDEIEPLMVMYQPNNGNVFIKVKSDDIRASMQALESSWTEVNPNTPFTYEFVDQDFGEQYVADQKRGQIFTVFSGLTIFIACLGLLGLTAFTTEQRTKEIGIRKVIGASVQGLLVLVSKEFFILVAIATCIAFPAAWYFMDKWLQSFAYKVAMVNEITTFIISGVLAFAITLLTVGFHTLRAATANPVNALKDE